ncbi:MAG TPA: HigA family addiction module antitoxin [Thermomicrobiales bacterium]|nr:HigA family addiction module antitoxin [Thermomicrobiales bacterium]
MLPVNHPGVVLAEELDLRGITGAGAARSLGIPQSRISNIIRGRTGITADTALRLGRWLGTGPQFWLNLQKDYELRLAESEVGIEIERTVQPIAVGE